MLTKKINGNFVVGSMLFCRLEDGRKKPTRAESTRQFGTRACAYLRGEMQLSQVAKKSALKALEHVLFVYFSALEIVHTLITSSVSGTFAAAASCLPQ